MLKNAVLNSQMSTNHMVCVTYYSYRSYTFDWEVIFSNFQPSWTFAKLRVNRVQPWRSPLDCDLKSFEILFLDFVNLLTSSSVSVYLHLSVGHFMTRASRWSSKRLQDLKFDWLQVQLTFRLVSPMSLESGTTAQLGIKWLLKWGHFSRSLICNYTISFIEVIWVNDVKIKKCPEITPNWPFISQTLK